MDAFWTTLRTVHIVTGFVGLVVAPVAFLTFKGGRLHRAVGWVYVAAMLTAGLSACVLAVHRDNAFLGVIGVFSLYLTANGVRALRRRPSRPNPLAWFDALVALAMFAVAVWMLAAGNVVLLVFGVIAAVLATLDLMKLARPPRDPKAWYFAHMAGMTASYLSATSAFAVTSSPAWVPMAVRFLGPTAVGVPLLFVAIRRTKRRFATRPTPPTPLASPSQTEPRS